MKNFKEDTMAISFIFFRLYIKGLQGSFNTLSERLAGNGSAFFNIISAMVEISFTWLSGKAKWQKNCLSVTVSVTVIEYNGLKNTTGGRL